MAALRDLPFEAFVEFQFGHAIRLLGNPWYFDADGDWWWPEPRTGIAFLTRLFAEGATVLKRYQDDQIAQGLTGLVNTMAVGDQPWMRDPVTPAEARAAVWNAVAVFFRDVLAPRCAPEWAADSARRMRWSSKRTAGTNSAARTRVASAARV